MKLIYILLWFLLIIEVMSEKYNMNDNQQTNQSRIIYPVNIERHKRSLQFDKLILKVKIKGKSKIINLISTNQILANEHLPVWISLAEQGKIYQKLHEVMRQDVGKFTLYHDYYTKSAIVYFHKRGQLDGIINIRYKIEGLPIDKLDEEHVIGKSKYFNFIKIGKSFQQSRRSNQCSIEMERCQTQRQAVYPELLVAISHDMFQAIEKNSGFPFGVKTISHVLTLYNIVDMMFKYVKSVDISINIAGIVIESTENEWGFVDEGHSTIDIDKINDYVDKYFRNKENNFPRYSYDYVAYNTRKIMLTSMKIPVHGISTSAGYGHMFYPHDYHHRSNFAVTDLGSYAHYTTITHELAHVFTAEHDKLVNWFFIHPCKRSIMAAVDCSSRYCLKWSDKTEEEFEKFFNSPAHCILKNKPQSLLPSWQKRFRLTRLQQCQCYGYKSYFKPNNKAFFDNECSREIMCMNHQDQVVINLPYPMNGTPCGKDEVCWDEKCVPYV